MSVSPETLDGVPPAGQGAGTVLSKAATGAKFALFVLFAINSAEFLRSPIARFVGRADPQGIPLERYGAGIPGHGVHVMYASSACPWATSATSGIEPGCIAIGTAVWSLLTAATGMAQNYTQIFIARLGVGLGEATCAPAGQSLIGDFFPPSKRAFAMGVFMLGLPAGLFLAYYSSGIIYAHLGWRAAFYIACVPGLIFALLALVMREPKRGGLDPGRVVTTSTGSLTAPYFAVLGLPTMWWIILSGHFPQLQHVCLGLLQLRVPAALSWNERA